MKNHAILALSLCTVALFTACKSQESAYRQAYERAKAQEQQQRPNTTTVAVPTQPTTPVVNNTVNVAPAEENVAVRTISGGVTVVNGEALKEFSVVTGSFINQTNAEGMMSMLRNRGYAARVVKTNETINGHTGWYRVIASSFDTKAQAAQSRNTLNESYPGAWILQHK